MLGVHRSGTSAATRLVNLLVPEPPAIATELSRVTAGQLIRRRRPGQEGHEGVRRRGTWALMRRLGRHVRRAS